LEEAWIDQTTNVDANQDGKEEVSENKTAKEPHKTEKYKTLPPIPILIASNNRRGAKQTRKKKSRIVAFLYQPI